MAIIALANLKGGVGKPTLAVNIAGVLAPKSVLVDAERADPGATARALDGMLGRGEEPTKAALRRAVRA